MSDGSRVYPVIGIGYVRTYPEPVSNEEEPAITASRTEMLGIFAGSSPYTNGIVAGYVELQSVSADPDANMSISSRFDPDGFRVQVMPMDRTPADEPDHESNN